MDDFWEYPFDRPGVVDGAPVSPLIKRLEDDLQNALDDLHSMKKERDQLTIGAWIGAALVVAGGAYFDASALTVALGLAIPAVLYVTEHAKFSSGIASRCTHVDTLRTLICVEVIAWRRHEELRRK